MLQQTNARTSGGGIGANSQQPERTTQVDDCLNSIFFALDNLETVGALLCRRLEPITGSLVSDPRPNTVSAPMVPLAAKLAAIHQRLQYVNDDLHLTVDRLEV